MEKCRGHFSFLFCGVSVLRGGEGLVGFVLIYYCMVNFGLGFYGIMVAINDGSEC